MKGTLALATVFGFCLGFSGEVLAGGSKWSQGRAGGTSAGVARGGAIQRHWKPSLPVAPHHHFRHHRHYYYPYSYQGHNPRSVIIITPSAYYPHYAPATVVTSEPFYCHMHYVGFVSRVGFLDHISGTHKIPLETANSICTDANDSCVIEGY